MSSSWRARVCCFVPPLTRGGQEGFAATKLAFYVICRLTPPRAPFSGGKWTNKRFSHILWRLYAMALTIDFSKAIALFSPVFWMAKWNG
jgi:hypothetical protein